jgi:hypothetical protein
MWASPKTQLRLAAARQDDIHRAADHHRRSRPSVDDVPDMPAEARMRLGRRLVMGRLLDLVSRS